MLSIKQTIKSLLPERLRPKEVAARYLAGLAEASEVVAGPFRGLRCPSEEMLSANWPKVLGVYEKELHPIFCRHRFAHVLNVGGAEGFYATGLARLWPGCRVIAWEAEPSGREAIRHYAEVNGVQDQIEVRGFCDRADLQRALIDRRGPETLVLMDIEGGEEELLAGDNIELLASCSILVEVHDLRAERLGEKLTSRFAATHNIEEIWTQERTFGDFEAVPNPLQRLYLLEQLKDAANEKRGTPMRWFWMTPKENKS